MLEAMFQSPRSGQICSNTLKEYYRKINNNNLIKVKIL